MNKLEAIEKVKRLRALAGNQAASIEEAATAAKIAERILQEHAIAEAEIEFISGGSESCIQEDSPATFWGERQIVWQNVLLTSLTKAYNCSGTIRKNQSGSIGYYLIGRPSDIATVRYQFLWFVVELNRLASVLAPPMSRGEGRNWHNSFYNGAVEAIARSLKSVKVEAQAVATSNAMVVINRHSEEAEALLRKLHPRAKTVSMKVSGFNRNAYEAGFKAGSGLHHSPTLGNGTKGLLK